MEWSRSQTLPTAPSDLIIIGRYVLTPDVFDEIAVLKPGAIGEIQLTDALRAQAARAPFHGVLSEVERFDTGTPVGYLQAAISITMRRPEFGAELVRFVERAATRARTLTGRPDARRRHVAVRRKRWLGSSRTKPNSSTVNSRTAPLVSTVRRYVRSSRRS